MSDTLLQESDFTNTGEEADAKSQFKPGVHLYGYCCGAFGRDSYETKTIVAIREDLSDGSSTVLARLPDGAMVYSFPIGGDAPRLFSDILKASNAELKSRYE
jgi:hypothetical protein